MDLKLHLLKGISMSKLTLSIPNLARSGPKEEYKYHEFRDITTTNRRGARWSMN